MVTIIKVLSQLSGYRDTCYNFNTMRYVESKLGIVNDILDAWKANESLCVTHKFINDYSFMEKYEGPPSLVQFTSGTTGTPKAVAIPWDAVEARCAASREIFNISSESITVSAIDGMFTPEVFSFILETHRQNGIIVLRDEILSDPSHADNATIYFGTPFTKPPKFNGNNLKFVIFVVIGATDVHRAAAQAWAPNAKVVTWYGCRETGAVTFSSGESIANGYVGKPVKGMEVRVVDGVLQARGPQLAYSYVDRPLPMDGDWLIMGDKAEINTDGSIRLLGRATPRF